MRVMTQAFYPGYFVHRATINKTRCNVPATPSLCPFLFIFIAFVSKYVNVET